MKNFFLLPKFTIYYLKINTKRIGILLLIITTSCLFPPTLISQENTFASTLTKFFQEHEYSQHGNSIIWEQQAPTPFSELILSWNALRPLKGFITFWVSVLHKKWAPWHRLAVWGPNYQRTFVNKLNPFVHTKHVRIEMQRKQLGRAFRIKAVFSKGAPKHLIKAFFACLSRDQYVIRHQHTFNAPSYVISEIPYQSQMELEHPRSKDLCSPTALSMITRYFADKLYGPIKHQENSSNYAIDFAEKVHDNGLDIYGNWLLNIAEAYNASQGDVFYRVERLNNFEQLYHHIKNNVPIAVSVRRLKGGATPYANGHFIVVIGWDNETKSVICIDPAFTTNPHPHHNKQMLALLKRRGLPNTSTIKAYHIRNFLRAWKLSCNLSYVPLIKQPL